jgi:hypothetical protein
MAEAAVAVAPGTGLESPGILLNEFLTDLAVILGHRAVGPWSKALSVPLVVERAYD